MIYQENPVVKYFTFRDNTQDFRLCYINCQIV